MFKDFIDWTVSTSKHKTKADAIACALLGIGGEVYEYVQKRYEEVPTPAEEEIKKELGDICWYIGHLCYRIEYVPQHLDFDVNLFDDGYPTVFKLQELYKKVIRDFSYVIPEHLEQRIHTLVSLIYSMVLNECDDWGWDFKDILELVTGKLEDRKKRGVIGGEGDNR